MNIKDVKNPELPEEDLLVAMFSRQRELMEKYHKIEESNGLLLHPNIPVEIECPLGQHRLKDFMWRITEELGEAMSSSSEEHLKEELADALHFLIELCILSDITIEEIHEFRNKFTTEDLIPDSPLYLKSQISKPTEFCFEIILCLTKAGNTLKQRPWKQTHQLTDIPKYKFHMCEAFCCFTTLCKYYDIDSEELYMLYFRKNQVNQFRIKSKY